MICVKRINERNVKQRMLFERSEFIRCSVVSEILSKSFAVLILWYFLIKKKVHRINSFGEHASFATFLEFILSKVEGLRKVGVNILANLIYWCFSIKKKTQALETVYTINTSKDYIIIDVRNDYCFIRCAEPNNHIL